jgi:hypothetical protein
LAEEEFNIEKLRLVEQEKVRSRDSPSCRTQSWHDLLTPQLVQVKVKAEYERKHKQIEIQKVSAICLWEKRQYFPSFV